MAEQHIEPASFRDPAATVFYDNGRVLRGLDAQAARDWSAVRETRFFGEMTASARVVGTRELAPDDAVAGGFDLVLEHDRIAYISYPYEWTFGMLRDAALLHLDILLAALGEGIGMKDAYAFNIQWRGVAPVFIDIGSFEPSSGGPWVGYRQFCRTFLYPLLLEAHLGVPFQRFLLGDLEGLDPTQMRRLFGGMRRFKKGVFRNVYLHSIAETRVTQGSEQTRRDLGKAGFDNELALATMRKLRKLVTSLRSRRADSGWKSYRETCSYSDADRVAKEQFVRDALDGLRPDLVYDLGANDGAYARIAAERAGQVVAVDSDDVTVDAMYRSLREDNVTNVLPLVMNLVDPSPARGWRGLERRAFEDRARPDVVLALALVHHLALAANVPLPEVVSWLRAFGGTLIVEFVEPADPMAKRLLGNKREGLFPDYRIDAFEAALAKEFELTRQLELPSGTRTLYLAQPR